MEPRVVNRHTERDFRVVRRPERGTANDDFSGIGSSLLRLNAGCHAGGRGFSSPVDPGRRVETHDAIASVYERFGNRHAVAATNVENARASRERGSDRERFRHPDGPAAIGPYQSATRSVLSRA